MQEFPKKIEGGMNPSRIVEKVIIEGKEVETEYAALSSVELNRTAKGQTQPSVKVYHQEPEEAKRIAQKIYDELCASYPME
uniref:Uncharacterized protein n=1 Tax=viral metagenome TaxID=1070528 RepID=A0A6H1ZGM0_9ZZZZ